MEVMEQFSNLHCTVWGLSYAPLSHTWDVHTLISVSTLWFLQSEYWPWRVRKTHTFKININKTDPLISWLALIATQTTWIHPILDHWSSQTCGFFCQRIENPCSMWNFQIIDCSSLLMDQREMWVHDHSFYGCFPARCLWWLVLVIFLHYKTCKL